MAGWQPHVFDGVYYTEPRDEVLARVKKAEQWGDTAVALSLDLVRDALIEPDYCEARTVINGDRYSKTLVEIKCMKPVDPRTKKHSGMHSNRKHVWE